MARHGEGGGMASLRELTQCPDCGASIQRTPCDIPYCPSRECPAVKGEFDWEVVPIILAMMTPEELREARAIARGPGERRTPDAKPIPTHCWKCGTALIDYHGPFGPYCPAKDCDVMDGVGMTAEEFRQATDPDGAKTLARALRNSNRR
jgi:hypothetical protein